MKELFDVPTSLSPRLAWMKKHGIINCYHAPGHCPPKWFAGFQVWWPKLKGVAFFAEETATNGDSRLGEGDTADDALEQLAKNYGLKLWNEEVA